MAGDNKFSGDAEAGIVDDVDSEVFNLAVSPRASFNADSDAGLRSMLIGAMSYATGDSTLTMNSVDPITDTAFSQSYTADLSSFDLVARWSLGGMNRADWPIRPHVEAGYTASRQDATRIGGANAQAITVDEVDTTQ